MKRRRPRLREPLDRLAGAAGHDVHQYHVEPGAGRVRGDARAHRSGADHADTRDRRHSTASSRVAMPWPPPMHCVDTA